MHRSRRHFLQTSALLSMGGLISSSKLFASKERKKEIAFGIQLWSVRDDMGKDAASVLKQLSGYGYKQIESCDLGKTIFWGMKPLEFKKHLDDLGLSMPSAHCDISKNFEQTAADAASVGAKYLICPWLGPQKSIDDYKKAADNFNAKGEICKKNGLRFAYHNHDYSFKITDGELPQNVMMKFSDPTLVDFEMDMYWVVTAGQDPIQWIQNNKNRFKLCHIKDRSKNVDAANKDASCNLGTGAIDFKTILPIAKKCGMEYFHVEQEKWEDSTPMKSAEANAVYMKGVKV